VGKVPSPLEGTSGYKEAQVHPQFKGGGNEKEELFQKEKGLRARHCSLRSTEKRGKNKRLILIFGGLRKF